LFGVDLRLLDRRIHFGLLFGGCRSNVHGVLLIVDGALGRLFVVVDGRLILVAAHEDEGGEGEYYRYEMFHVQFWLFTIAVGAVQALRR
jgi:hypothetical protein